MNVANRPYKLTLSNEERLPPTFPPQSASRHISSPGLPMHDLTYRSVSLLIITVDDNAICNTDIQRIRKSDPNLHFQHFVHDFFQPKHLQRTQQS